MKNKKLFHCIAIIVLFVCNSLFSQQTFQEWSKKQQDAFESFATTQNNYNNDTTLAYQTYLDQQQQQFLKYRAQVEQKWGRFKGSTQKIHVDYDQDLNARGTIDFEKGKLEVEVLIDDKVDEKNLSQKQIGKAKLEEKISQMVSSKADDGRPLLDNQLKTNTGNIVNNQNAKNYAKEVVSNKKIKKKSIKSKDGKRRVKYTVTINLLPDHLEIRAKRFKDIVIDQSSRFGIDPALVLAIMHTESNFNPRARSPVPAYGLMQLVPKTGARDAYLFVYNQDRVLKADYLYIPKNNIELGCAYIKKIRSVYFKEIKNDISAYYCTIAAYNTGPGNVAKALTGEKKLKPAINQINKLAPNQLYSKLINNLPYRESRKYLKIVDDRVEIYK